MKSPADTPPIQPSGGTALLLPRKTIHVLPEGVANRIAAGEVVERPASVVKELIENALDAEAARITVAVKQAGLDEIIVSDDGFGMDAEDMELAFRRHATSKIYSAEDLDHILHLGFRGEALPSIASVARIDVVSRREDRDSGYRYRVEGGKSRAPEPAPRERGTTVKVRSLFFNVPARRKFLRTPATEYGRVVSVFRQYALAYPELTWELLRDEKNVWLLQPTDLKGRIAQLFGDDAAGQVHPVESRSGDIFVGGVVGGVDLFKRTRGDQYLFINRRPFQNSSLHHAVVNGYGPLIEPGRVPFYMLNLRLAPEEFDVNVHPAKHEIRFRDESLAYRSVLVAVRGALGISASSGGSPVTARFGFGDVAQRTQDGLRDLQLLFGRHPQIQNAGVGSQPGEGGRSVHEQVVPPPPEVGERLYQRGKSLHEAEAAESGIRVQEPGAGTGEASAPTYALDSHTRMILPHEAEQGGSIQAATPGGERINVWQVHRTYIFSQTKSGLVIIDQHVAHERILFEKALAAMQEKPWAGQVLLFPVTVKLDPADSALLEEIAPGLLRMGFQVEPFGGTDWVIRAVPSRVKVKGEERLLRAIIADYRQEHQIRVHPEESLAASFACKAAIKAGDVLSLEEMNALIDELFTTQYPFVCPHGRPVVVNFTLSEIHRLFGRE
ncbi:MAG: DNA mismatch repair endonuclease MutL [bacterium]